MRRLFLHTIVLSMGLSIVPVEADAQFFKKLFGKKNKTEAAEGKKNAKVQQLVMADPATLDDNSNNRNGFLGIPLGIDAEEFNKLLLEKGFAAREQKEKQTSKTYKYDGEVYGAKCQVTLLTSEKTNTVYAVDVADPNVYQSDAAIAKRNAALKEQLAAVYGKGYVNKMGECYTIVTPLGTVNMHYERITIGGGYTIGFSVDDAKAYNAAYGEMEDNAHETLPRAIDKGLAAVPLHSDIVGVGVAVMEAKTLQKARKLLAAHDYAVGKTTSKGLTATLKLAAGYQSTVNIRRRGSVVNTLTITASDEKELVTEDLLRAGFTDNGKQTYKNGRIRVALAQDKQGRQVLKFTAVHR